MSVEHWMGCLAPSTGYYYGRHLVRFLDWLKERGLEADPDRLVEMQRTASGDDSWKILDLVQEYVTGLRGRFNTKRNHYVAIRSFFLHNRAGLPRDPSFRLRGDSPKIIDSLTAMLSGFAGEIDRRNLVRMLYRIVRKAMEDRGGKISEGRVIYVPP